MSTQPQIFEIGKDYVIPSWSGKPQKNYFLEVIKQGAIIEEKQIHSKEFYLIGKYRELSDIVLEHMSISRKHAIIQHKNNGEIFIQDLGSSYGTVVNNKKLPSKIFHKLNIFDTIKFGMSTRMYILRCPELEEQEHELEQEKEESKNQDKDKKPEKTLKEIYVDMLENDPYYKQQLKSKKKFLGTNSNNQDGISWGQVDELEVYQFQENDLALAPEILKRLPDLTEKQNEKILKYEQRLSKYRNTEDQLQELVNKEKKQFGLEQRLQEKKENLQGKIMELGPQVEQAEQALRLSLFGESEENEGGNNLNQKRKYQEQDTFDDDEFFDRSIGQKKQQVSWYQAQLEKKQKKKETTTEDYWNLKKRLESLIKVRHHYNLKLLEMKDDREDSEKKGQDEEEDEFEKFMSQTGKELNQENKEIIKKKLIEYNKEIEQITEMLQHIKPDLKVKKDGDQKISDVFGGDEEEATSSKNKKKQLEKEQAKKEIQKTQEKQYAIPQSRISKTLDKLKQLKQNHDMDINTNTKDCDDDDEEEMDDEKILELAGKQLKRESEYLKKINVDEDEEFDQKRSEYFQQQHFMNSNDNIGNKQKVFDVSEQGLKKSKKKIREEEKEKQEQEERKQIYDSILTPFADE